MKGRLPEEEIAAIPAMWTLTEVVPLQVPGLNEERHLLIATCRLAP
jgi:16S rRNA (guanine527-N7)-methyltransferase